MLLLAGPNVWVPRTPELPVMQRWWRSGGKMRSLLDEYWFELCESLYDEPVYPVKDSKGGVCKPCERHPRGLSLHQSYQRSCIDAL